MLFKQSVIFLFAVVVGFAVAKNIDEYDIPTLRKMLRTQDICSTGYKNYMDNCTTIYHYKINQCTEKKAASKLELEKESFKNHQKFIQTADDSCKEVISCNKATANLDSNFNSCFANEAGKAYQTMDSLQYEANSWELDYVNQTYVIESINTDCVTWNTWYFSAQSNAGLDELMFCNEDGSWTLSQPLSEIPEAITASVLPVTNRNKVIKAKPENERLGHH